MSQSTGTLIRNVQSKTQELKGYWLAYQGSPDDFAKEFPPAIADIQSMLNEKYEIFDQEFIGKTGKNASLANAMIDEIRSAKAELTDLKISLKSEKLPQSMASPIYKQMDSMLDRLDQASDALKFGVGELVDSVPIPTRADLAANIATASSSAVMDSDSGDETEKPFVAIVAKRRKQGKTVATDLAPKKRTMSLAEFRLSAAVEDDTPINETECTWGFSQRDRNAMFYRTHATYGRFKKGTDILVPPSKLKDYAPALLEKREIHPPSYVAFSECPLDMLKAAVMSKYIPQSVYKVALNKGLFCDDFGAVPNTYTFVQVEKATPGAGEIADVLFWQAQAETLLRDYGFEAKIPFIEKWFPRILDVPDCLRSTAPEAARHFYEWLSRDMRKSKEERNPNSTFNGFLQGMLAKWPRGWERDEMIKRYTPAINALWGKDIAPLFIREFKTTNLGRQLIKPKHIPAVQRLMKLAATTRAKAVEAVQKVEEAASAAPEKLAEARKMAAEYIGQTARLEKAATWREQMAIWNGRFRRSLPDFSHTLPGPLRVIMNSETRKEVVVKQSWTDTAKVWAAYTIGFPFFRFETAARSGPQEHLSIVETKIEARPWWRATLDYVFNVTEAEDGVRVYEPVPGVMGTTAAWLETFKYLAYDLPAAAINHVGLLFNNTIESEDAEVPWPKFPRIGTAIAGSGFATLVGTAAALIFAPTLGAAQAALGLGGAAALVARDFVSWVRGTPYDEDMNMWYQLRSNRKDEEDANLLFEAIETDMKDVVEIEIRDIRSASPPRTTISEEGVGSPPAD